MLSNSQKEHLTYTAIGQTTLLVALAILGYQYIIPGISTLRTEAEETQKIIEAYQSTYDNGIPELTLQNILSSKPEYAELIKIIQSDPEYAKNILIKENMSITGSTNFTYDCTTTDYYTCLKTVLGRVEKEKESIKNEKAKLNSIIPTMSPFSNNIEENNITLRDYVKYIEKTILRKFNFDSNIVIGMQGINFGKKSDGVPESIGMFEFRLDFSATNEDILDFIDYVNNSGKPDILSFTGVLAKNEIPEAMSNPLITMENFSVRDRLDRDNPTKENSGRATLKFYVRGVSKDDLKFLAENLKTRKTELETRISESVRACEKDGVICASYNKKLLTFQKKFQEYSRSIGTTRLEEVGGGSDQIYVLIQSANTLKSLEQELDAIIPKAKISN